jgi:hypothetical protein
VRRKRRIDWGLIAVWLAVLIYVVTAWKVKLPAYGLIVLAGLASVASFWALGWWRPPLSLAARHAGRLIHEQALNIRRETALRSCRRAIAELTALLPNPVENGERHWYDIPGAMEDRRILATYRETTRQTCVDALVDIGAVVLVREHVAALADHPRSVQDLHHLLLWLSQTASRLRSGPSRLSV